jgi:hypothetical protein
MSDLSAHPVEHASHPSPGAKEDTVVSQESRSSLKIRFSVICLPATRQWKLLAGGQFKPSLA